MNKSKCSLKESVRTAFERACREQYLEIAEPLLQALEILARREGNGDELKRAYLTIASSLHERH